MQLLRTTVLLALVACGDNVEDAGDAPVLDTDTIDAPGVIDFTETYGAGTTDIGDWILTTNADRVRTIEASGGNPDGYLYGDVSTATPAWSTASTRFHPGADDPFKRDSVFVGDYRANDIRAFSADIELLQVGNWSSNRTVTLHLVQWDAATNARAFEAFYSLPDLVDPPSGWVSYSFPIAARSATVPAGWKFLRTDGSAGTGSEWSRFMQQIDLVELVFAKPGYLYPSTGVWDLGIDNIHISALP